MAIIKTVLFVCILLISDILTAKEIKATSLLSGMYPDSYGHLQEYQTDLRKRVSKYKRYETKKLKYDISYIVKTAGKINFKKSRITKISYKQAKGNKLFEFNIDSTILAFVIELQNKNSSKNATVKLFDPNGELVVNDSENGIEVLDFPASSIIKITKPIYGKWRMEFDENSDFTGRISGITPIRARSFSFQKITWGREGLMPTDIKKPLPIIGSPSKVVLFGEKLYDEKSIKVKFVNLDTGKSKQAEIESVYGDEIYLKREKSFGKMFDIYVEGKDINGYPFTRKTKMPFSDY